MLKTFAYDCRPLNCVFQVDHVSVNRSFVYNVVFEPEALQEDVFDHSGVKKLIDMSING